MTNIVLRIDPNEKIEEKTNNRGGCRKQMKILMLRKKLLINNEFCGTNRIEGTFYENRLLHSI